MSKLSESISSRKITTLLIVANILVFSLCISDSSGGTARITPTQNNERVITTNTLRKNEPIEISDININGRTIKLGEPFVEDGEWLKNVKFKVVNKSDKVITYIVLNIDFPETLETGSIMIHSLYLGNSPDSKSTLG
ncbi:MAG: hypothetical protein M3362_23735, partial [Acidobacteriota bacterium]|nr:hypothetical protein [Acidobacteriota bacterium]